MLKNSFKEFMSRLIDYAGLFPPADLQLIDAYNNYLEYITESDEWMIGKFICPVNLLEEVQKIMVTTKILKMQFSILLSGGENEKTFFDNLERDLIKINKFKYSVGNLISMKSFETKIPSDVINVKDFLNSVLLKLKEKISNDFIVFFEPQLNDNWKENITELVKTISEINFNNNIAGTKLRTGGVTADSFPKTEIIAYTIKICDDFKIPFKATAGLHHPVKHYNDSVKTKMNGFINVFGAGILSFKNNLNVDTLIDIINEENPDEFIFTDNEFIWKNIKVNTNDIKYSREKSMFSFGSCSFDEPREDLKKLNLL